MSEAEKDAHARQAAAAWRPPSTRSSTRSRRCRTTMRQLWWMKLFQWYGMVCYWHVHRAGAGAHDVRHAATPTTVGFRDAGLLNGQIGGFYNFIAFVAAFAMVPFTKRLGAKPVHALCLTLAGIGMWAIPSIHDEGAAVRADDRRRPGLGLDHGQSLRAAGRQHPARARRRVHGHLQHVHRHPDADPDGHAAAVLQQPARRRPGQRDPPGWHLAHHRGGVRFVRAKVAAARQQSDEEPGSTDHLRRSPRRRRPEGAAALC